MNHNARTYFDIVAEHYLNNSMKGLWGWFKKKEADAIVGFMNHPRIVLDIGCGSGYYSNIIKDLFDCHVTCVDISTKMLDNLDRRFQDKICIQAEEFTTENKFDLILCIGMLEFSNDPGKVFSNVSKMLSPDGTFIILIPTKNIIGLLYKIFHKAHGLNIRLYDMKEIDAYASNAKLIMQQIKQIQSFSTIISFINGQIINEK